jgi:hypothetical protein
VHGLSSREQWGGVGWGMLQSSSGDSSCAGETRVPSRGVHVAQRGTRKQNGVVYGPRLALGWEW